jgi:DnaJ-class molecular chaperone
MLHGEKIPDQDLYEVLGIQRNANTEEIKKAFRKLALQFHPDRPMDDEERGTNTEKFKQVNEAKEWLSDPEKRAVYDSKHGYGGWNANQGERFQKDYQQEMQRRRAAEREKQAADPEYYERQAKKQAAEKEQAKKEQIMRNVEMMHEHGQLSKQRRDVNRDAMF